MAKYRTRKSERTVYKYTGAYGSTVELQPGVDGVTEAWISLLHELDDAEINEIKRDEYHDVLHLDGAVPTDQQGHLADHSSNPETILLESNTARALAFNQVYNSLDDDQRQLVDALEQCPDEKPQRKSRRKTVVRISNYTLAKELGVNEGTIRYRKKKLQEAFADLKQ